MKWLTSTAFFSVGNTEISFTMFGTIASIASTSALIGARVRYIKVAAHVHTVEALTIRAALSTECINTTGAVVLALWTGCTKGGDGKEHSKTRES